MDHQDLLREVMERSKSNSWCQECLQEIDRHEEAFTAIREQLSEEQQEQLDLYIAACEAFCDSHIFVAYQIGREHGEIAAYRPYETFNFTHPASKSVILSEQSESKDLRTEYLLSRIDNA